MHKKILSVFLTILMLCTLLPVSAFAQNGGYASDNTAIHADAGSSTQGNTLFSRIGSMIDQITTEIARMINLLIIYITFF